MRNESLYIFTYRDVELSQWFLGRAVIIGDAAHSMSPQLGTGAQLAMADAASLADALKQRDVVSDALQAYTLIRSRQVRRYHRASRLLTPLFQSQGRIAALLRDHLLTKAMQLPFAKRFAHALLS
jgi:2-polyprenyl-6-methoxyphenol hydroxylase-like FAD-dependent oxidoreductase